MPSRRIDLDELRHVLLERAVGGRLIVALAGPPGSGKSTLSELLVESLNADVPGWAAVLPMDGFHYDDLYLTPAGLRPRKGAPDTFDVGGLEHALQRLRSRNADHVAVPIFDRQLEIARAGANSFLRRRESSWSRGTICFCAGSLGPACHRCSTSPFSSRPQMMSCVSGCQQGGGHTILRRTRLPRSSTATIYRTRGLLSRRARIRTFALRICDRPLATRAVEANQLFSQSASRSASPVRH